jgi:hypothetical protein
VVDNRPIASGLVTQDIMTDLLVDRHLERLALAVILVDFPVSLGLDWLRQHNPSIDWADPNLSLLCCNLLSSSPVSV